MRMRMLNLDLPADAENYVPQDNGGLLVRNVVLLAPGVWTDSGKRSACYYPPAVLEECAGNWESTTFWARHHGGAPRNIITDRLGDVIDPHWDGTVDNGPDNEMGALMGSVLYDGLTQASRDGAVLALMMAKEGRPLAVSVEWGGKERFNEKRKCAEAAKMFFGGLAAVDRGACKICGLPATLEDADQGEGENDMDEAELDQKLAALKAEILAAVDEKLAASQPAEGGEPGPAPEAQMSKLSAAYDALNRELSEAKKKIEALEKRPQPRTAPEHERDLELEVPEGYTMRGA